MDRRRTTDAPIENLKDTSQVTRDDVKQMGSAALDVAQGKYQDIKDTALEKVESVRQSGRERAVQLESRIREDPLRSVLIASGIGFLLGKIFSRR